MGVVLDKTGGDGLAVAEVRGAEGLGVTERDWVCGRRTSGEGVGAEGRIRVVLGDLAHIFEAGLELMSAAANGGDIAEAVCLGVDPVVGGEALGAVVGADDLD